MNLIKKITAGTLALVLATGIAGGALAKDSGQGDASVTIDSNAAGALTVSIDTIAFDPVTYSLEEQDRMERVTITAADARGTAYGWTVTITGNDLTDDEKDLRFGINNLSFEPTGVLQRIGPNTTMELPAGQNVAAVSGSQQNVLAAAPGSGAGEYTSSYNASLNIPAGTLPGEYESTLTVTITGSGPGEDTQGDD